MPFRRLAPSRFLPSDAAVAPRTGGISLLESVLTRRGLLSLFSVAVLLYSVAVLSVVAWMGDIGIRCVFGIEVKEAIPNDYAWDDARPRAGDTLLRIDGRTLETYSDYIKALRGLGNNVGQWIDVSWRDQSTGETRVAKALIRYRPLSTYIWSWLWFLQELVIFAIGARVFWKRPHDDSARLFFGLCIVTVGAFMGGYHWTEIVVEPILIYGFAAFAIFVPVFSLHFYLVFPRPNPVFARYRRPVLAVLYGVPLIYLALLWGSMLRARWLGDHLYDASTVYRALRLVRGLALGYIGLSVVLFGLCILCLVVSYRSARSTAERNQVRWILLASLISSLLIAYLLRQAWFDPSTLGRDSAAWPMVGVSLLYTLAYALSITRYKLMQVEEIINRSVVYFVFSVTAGLLYSVVLVLSGFVIGGPLRGSTQTSHGAMVAGLTVIVILILSEIARERFQRVIERRFHGEKYKFDEAMGKMRLAVGSLVDRETLGRRLLEAAAEVLRLEWGAIYLAETAEGPWRLAACYGPAPDEQILNANNALVQRLQKAPAMRLPHAMSLSTASDRATDAMIALGGEAAHALDADGTLGGLLVLGPKRSGMPYEDEELSFLGALSSVAALALHSADIQTTLETLNQELREKVEAMESLHREVRDKAQKIAEQQRRISILQDQLMDRGDLAQPPPAEWDARPGAFDEIKGSSPEVRIMIERARKVAGSPSAVLIRGESGTGKELLAAAIHNASARATRPFVKVHCAALSQSLLESELFGHVKGAFTGADRDRIGRFEQANGGTLFLDEIGDINLEVQTKLLRVLQEMSFERVGSSQPISVDVRILAATHQDLEALIRSGRFREDLYYRLNVFSLRTPALRERREDIFELAVHLLHRHAQRAGKAVTHLDEGAVESLVAYDWPGNIRELGNVIEQAVVLADGPALTREDLPPEIRQPGRRRLRLTASATTSRTGDSTGRHTHAGWSEPPPPVEEDWDAEVMAYERQRLLDVLNEAHSNKSEAARLLGMPRSTFCSKLKKHGLL